MDGTQQMKIVKHVWALVLVAMAGCGGGGGGAESGGLSIGAVTPGTVTATFSNKTTYEGGELRQVALSASFSGNAPAEVFVVIEDPDAVFHGADVQIDSATSATLRLTVDDGAAVGEYVKPMVLHVCRDSACSKEFDGSPRTIQKHITIRGTTLDTSALAFASTVGVGPASKAIAVTTPGGVDFGYEAYSYVEHTGPDGSTNLLSMNEVFSITKTSSGLVVQPIGNFAGHFSVTFDVTTDGYAKVPVELNYQVDAAATPVVTSLTSSVSGSGQAGSADDIPVYVEYVHVMARSYNSESSVAINATGGSPDTNSYNWIRYFDQENFTYGTGPAGNADRIRFFLNPCDLTAGCLAAGTYTANIVISVTEFSETSSFTVPVTFTIEP